MLAGLGSAQTKWHFHSSADGEHEGRLTAGYQWTPEPLVGEGEGQVCDEADRVGLLDPVFVVPVGVAERTRRFYEGRDF